MVTKFVKVLFDRLCDSLYLSENNCILFVYSTPNILELYQLCFLFVLNQFPKFFIKFLQLLDRIIIVFFYIYFSFFYLIFLKVKLFCYSCEFVIKSYYILFNHIIGSFYWHNSMSPMGLTLIHTVCTKRLSIYLAI